MQGDWYRVEKLGDGVYAVIDLDGGWFRSNTGLVDMGDYTLVIDTQYNEPRTKTILEVTRKLGLPRPGLIINTHHHGDHAWGNHVIQAPAIMHSNAAAMVEALRDVVPDIYKPFFPHLDYTGSKYTLPHIVVGGDITLNADKGKIHVRYLGPAHTTGDLIIAVEWAKVLYAGDIVFNKVTPLAVDGTIKGWKQALETIAKDYPDWKIVGGHGPIADKETIKLLIQYMKHLLGATQYLIEKQGLEDPLEIALKATPGPLQGWSEEERLVFNVARALMDLRGEPPGIPLSDLPLLARKMQAYRQARSTDN